MKVVCINDRLTKEQKKVLDITEENDFKYPFEVGKTYTVLGISNRVGSDATTMLEMPYFYAFPAPLCLFEIVDDRPSSYWKIKKLSEYEISLWPEEFYQEYFHDDLSDGVPGVVAIYKQIVERIEKEFD